MRFLCLLLTGFCALLALLIILPAPSYYCWLAAVVVSEWSVWMVVAGAIGLIWSAGGLLRERSPAYTWLSFIFSTVTIACAFIPIAQAYRVAVREGVSLSLRRYVLGFERSTEAFEVDEQRDVQFASPDGNPLRLDVYRKHTDASAPRANKDSLPLSGAVIVIHGGSWSGGAKSDFARYDRWLAENGRVVFDIEYRLADNANRFPKQLVDVRCAIGWIKSHSGQYGVDPRRIALLGRSAGGQLALLAAYTSNDATSVGNCGNPDTRVRAVISFYGPTDLAWDYAHPGQPDVIDTPHVLENYLGASPAADPAVYAKASPADQVTSQSPPTLLLHGGHDQLVLAANVDRLIPRLQEAGVPYGYVFLPWANHGFDYNFNGWSSQIAQARISEFLETYCDRLRSEK